MKEIKFRAWDIIARKMLYDIYPIDQKGTCKFGTGTVINCKLMQFTGRFDEDGKEIYEGDIMEFDNLFQSKEEYAKHPNKRVLVKWIERECAFSNCFTGKVIGNIYENPELLGGSK